jgi:hypothetical protein
VKNLFYVCLLLIGSYSFAQQISGDYIESRSADVYTGQCFANGEVNLVGNEAIMGWHVDRGSWNGVSIDGLNAVAVVRAKATLGDPYADPYPTQSVLVIDEAATPQQRNALQSFVREQTGKLTDNVAKVIYTTIDLSVVRNREHHGMALLRAGNFVTVKTRGIDEHDHICGNEVTFYPPLTDTTHAMPAVAEKDEYSGPGLNDTWSNSGKRSAFVGTFAR